MVLQNISLTFVGKFTNMAKHELTEKQIAALQKLGVTPSKFYKTHIPINSSNIYIAETSETLNRLSQAIAVDVYTSGNGKERLRSCYDSLRELNKHGKLGDVEPYLRQLNERVQYYLGILCGTIKSDETHNINETRHTFIVWDVLFIGYFCAHVIHQFQNTIAPYQTLLLASQ